MFYTRFIRSAVAVCFVLVLIQTRPVQASERLVVAIDKSYPPFSIVTPAGDPAGLIVEIWRLWSKETGIEVAFLPGTWEQSISMIQTGRADVHSGLFRNESRAEWMAFSDAIHSVKSALYHRIHTEAPSFDNLRGKKVGVVAGTHQLDYMEERHAAVSLAVFKDHETLLTALAAGEVDLIFDEVPTVTQYLASRGWQGLVTQAPESRVANSVHAAVLKSRVELVKQIDRGFNGLSSEKLAEIDGRWILSPEDRYYQDVTDVLTITLTEDEKSFLNNTRSISLASTPDWPPFEMLQNDGAYTGIAADFIRVAANKVGLEIKPVFDGNWSRHVDRLKQGELDVAPGLNETPKRLEHFIFTTPYIEYYSAIFTKAKRSDIQSAQDLKGKTVALEKGYAIAAGLAAERPDIDLMLVNTTLDALEAVSTGKADAYIGNQVVASYLIKKFTLPELAPACLWRTDLPGMLSFAVGKDRPALRSVLQKGLDAVTKEEREAILSTYLDVSGFKEKVFSLRQTQWHWLTEHPQLRLGVAPQCPPFEFFDDNGVYQGISSEYIHFIQDKIKVEMTPIQGLSWSEVLSYAESGRLDVITAIAKTPAREKYLNFTEPYIEFPIVIFSQKSAPLITSLQDISNDRVAAVKGYAAHEYLTSDYPGIIPVLFPTVADAVNSLALGDVDWFVNDLATGSYAIEQNGITTLKIAMSTEYTMPLAMGVRKDLPELVDILNKAIAVVTDDQAAEFKSKWLALKFEHGLDLATVLRWVLPISAGVMLVIGAILFWNRSLGREISARKEAQAELQQKNTQLEETQVELRDALGVITSSIRYASRIQRSILPDEKRFVRLVPDHFVLWQPRDVVGGDIYWNESWGEGVLVMLGDCTGHGVPGAFMTLLSNGAVERALLEVEPGDAAGLIRRMHQLLQLVLGQDQADCKDDASDDGLEMGACYIHPDMKRITYAGARFDLFIKKDGTVERLKGDRKGIGYRSIPFDFSYANKEVTVEEGAAFYMTTDGILDQIGGEKRRGFGKKRFKTLLLSLDDAGFSTQGDAIYKALKAYQGSEKRRDDVAVIGFKIG